MAPKPESTILRQCDLLTAIVLDYAQTFREIIAVATNKLHFVRLRPALTRISNGQTILSFLSDK